jgi:hypothetical protein
MGRRDISDAQVLKELRLRKVRLKMELDRVEIAIKAFENIKDVDPLDVAIYELDDVGNYNDIKDDLTKSILLYNPKMTAEKKILYALNHIEKGDASDITEYILKVDGHIKNTDKLFNNITYVASKMYCNGKLDAERVGKKNKYLLLKVN